MAVRSRRSDLDITEELNFTWTSGILLLVVSAVGVLRYIFLTSIITCWLPAQFTPSYESYTHQVCWNNEEMFVTDSLSRSNINKTFHQWIPVALVLMLLGFQIPRMFKLVTDILLGSPIYLVAENKGADKREDQASGLADVVRESTNRCQCIRTLALLTTKFLVCVNLLAQFIYVSSYFKDSTRTVVEDGNNTMEIPVFMFPKILTCNFNITMMQNIQTYEVQCQMPINDLYENFFYVWRFWILGVGIFSGLTFVAQFLSLVVPPLVSLRFRGIIPETFLRNRGCCLDDALLLLWDIQNSSGQAMAREVAVKVWGPRQSHPEPETEAFIMNKIM